MLPGKLRFAILPVMLGRTLGTLKALIADPRTAKLGAAWMAVALVLMWAFGSV